MKAEAIRAENFEILRFRYLESDASARRGRDRILKQQRSTSLERLLRSHYVEGIVEKEVAQRDEIDDLLAFYALIEVATMCGYVPKNLPTDFVDEATRVLSEPSVERFYKRYYPLLLVQLFSARIQGRFAAPILNTTDATRAFVRLLDVSELLKIDEVETFLWLLDDGVVDGENFDDVIERIQTPQALVASLTKDLEKRSVSDNAVHGFRGFTAFSREFHALLQNLEHSPMLQSAFWHYHGYWLQHLSGSVLGVMSMAIEQQRKWVTLDPVHADDDAEARDKAEARVRRTHASMDATELVLQRLTSGVYRAALERFYFDSELRAGSPQSSASENYSTVTSKPVTFKETRTRPK